MSVENADGVREELARFEQHFAAGRRGPAYLCALAVWRMARAPEIAQWIERLADAFCEREALDLGKLDAIRKTWVEIARQRQPFELRWLIGELVRFGHTQHPRAATIISACLAELGQSSDDPATTMPAIALCTVASSQTWDSTVKRWLKWMDPIGDKRAAPGLESASNAFRHRSFVTMGEEVESRMTRTAQRLAAQPPVQLPDDIAARVLQSTQRLDQPLPTAEAIAPSGTSEAELFARVLANPEDMEARSVWADALVASGDSRGEFVNLSIAARHDPKLTRKLNAQINKHWRTWVDPFSASIVRTTLEFDTGLLAGCAVNAKTQAVADLVLAHPMWRTVKRLTFWKHGRLTSQMQWLEEAYRVSESALSELASITLPRLHTLGIDPRTGVPGKQSNGLRALSRTTGLPALKALLFERSNFGTYSWRLEMTPWIYEAPWAKQLEVLKMPIDWSTMTPEQLGQWMADGRRLPNLRRAELTSHHIELEGFNHSANCTLWWDLERNQMGMNRPVDEPDGDPAEDSIVSVAHTRIAAQLARATSTEWVGVNESL